jgi:hypothetical protein
MGSVRMPGRRWRVLSALLFARAATGFQFQSVGSSARMLMQDLGIEYSQFGMLLGAYLLPGVVVAFPAAVGAKGIVAGPALLVTGVPLSVSFAFLSNPQRRAAPAHDEALRAAS